MRTRETEVFDNLLFGGLQKASPSGRAFRSWGTRHGAVADDHAQNGRHTESRNARTKAEQARHNAKRSDLRNAMRMPDLASIWTGGGR